MKSTVYVLSLAILQIRMKLKGVTASELPLLCDVHADAQARARAAQTPKAPRVRRRGRPVLRLVT